MSIDELVADVLTNYAVAWQSSDGAKCFGIAMELFNLIEQHVAEAVERERERCAKMADEYATWGGSNFYDWFKKLATAIRARAEKETT